MKKFSIALSKGLGYMALYLLVNMAILSIAFDLYTPSELDNMFEKGSVELILLYIFGGIVFVGVVIILIKGRKKECYY